MYRLYKIIIFTLFVSVQSCAQELETTMQTSKVTLSDYTKSFVSLDISKIALLNAKVFDGKGNPSKNSQTLLIQNGIIVDIGNANDVQITNDFYQINLSGKTVIPGIVGMHNHMRVILNIYYMV